MLEGKTYAPLLYARLAEMRALRELPTNTKNLIFPVVKIRPWLNSKSLDKCFEVIADAFGDRRFGFDLDEFKLSHTSDKLADREFARLFDAADGYRAYYDCVLQGAARIPVIRRFSGATPSMQQQVDRIMGIGRGAVVRVDLRQSGDYLNVAQLFSERSARNVVFAFDCGWDPEVLQRASACVSLVDSLLDVTDDFEVVVAASSFPDKFANRGTRFDVDIEERRLFQEVRRNINRGKLTYGDWGSTRPPVAPIPMKNVPRIDLAAPAVWNCWRSENAEDYEDLANRVVNDRLWTGNTALWGNYIVASTAMGTDPAIKSAAMAAAARVNLHMHAQAHFETPDFDSLLDEPVGDDL